jgi:hypothetical protein
VVIPARDEAERRPGDPREVVAYFDGGGEPDEVRRAFTSRQRRVP